MLFRRNSVSFGKMQNYETVFFNSAVIDWRKRSLLKEIEIWAEYRIQGNISPYIKRDGLFGSFARVLTKLLSYAAHAFKGSCAFCIHIKSKNAFK